MAKLQRNSIKSHYFKSTLNSIDGTLVMWLFWRENVTIETQMCIKYPDFLLLHFSTDREETSETRTLFSEDN